MLYHSKQVVCTIKKLKYATESMGNLHPYKIGHIMAAMTNLLNEIDVISREVSGFVSGSNR